MIRLRYLVESAVKNQLPDVLFISDDPDHGNKGFARKLIANGLVTGDIETYSSDDITEITNLVYYNASLVDDLIVIYYSGLDDIPYKQVIDNLSRIIKICNERNKLIALITVPTPKFVKKYDQLERRNAIIRNRRINDWILSSNADYVIDITDIQDDALFNNAGTKLDVNGNARIYKQLVRILKNINPTIDIDAEDNKIDTELKSIEFNKSIKTLSDLQTVLVDLGYEIAMSDIKLSKMGRSTKRAIRKFKQDYGLPYDSKVNKLTIDMLIKAIHRPKDPKKIISGVVTYTGGKNSNNVDVLIHYMNEYGITDPYTQIGILATCGKESGFEPQDEIGYSSTPNERIRKIFGDRVPEDDDELTTLKQDDEAFFNRVYGGMFGNGPDEGYLYRGRGLNGLTFKGNYEKYGTLVGESLVTNPEQVNDIDVAAKIAIKFFTKNKPANRLPKFKSVDEAVTYFVNLNAGGSGRSADHSRAREWANKFVIEQR